MAFIELKKGPTLIVPTRKEKGNIAYVHHYSIDNSDEIIFVEIWVDGEAIDNHFKQLHTKITEDSTSISQPTELKAYSEVKVD